MIQAPHDSHNKTELPVLWVAVDNPQPVKKGDVIMAHKSRLDKNEFNSTFQFYGTLNTIFNTLDMFERCIIFLI